MPSTTRYRRGDIVLVPFPFTDLSSTKKRPALVVSPDRFNAHAQDVVLVAITSQPADSHVVALDEHDYVDGKLPRTSFVKVSKLFTTHPTLVLKKVCAIKPAGRPGARQDAAARTPRLRRSGNTADRAGDRAHRPWWAVETNYGRLATPVNLAPSLPSCLTHQSR